MKAMILAAGLRTRLQPLTNTLPKPLLPLGGQPLIGWNLALLRRYGVTEVIINVHHLGDLIQEALGDGSKWGMALSYSVEKDLLGTGGGLKQVESFFGEQPFLVLNGDTVVDLNLSDMMERFTESGAVSLMALRDDPDVAVWGMVETDARHRILRINGRGGKAGGQPEGVHQRMFAGIHIMEPLLLHNIPQGTFWSIIDEYVGFLEKGAFILGYPFSGYWSDVGTLERYAQVQQDVLAGLLPSS